MTNELVKLLNSARDVRDHYNRYGPTWTGRDGHEYADMSQLLDFADDVSAALASIGEQGEAVAFEILRYGKRDCDPSYQDITNADREAGYESRPLFYATPPAPASEPRGETVRDELSLELAVEDAAKAAFVKAQSAYRADHDHFPLKATWETTDERVREGWRSIAYAAIEAATAPPLGTQPEPRQRRDLTALMSAAGTQEDQSANLGKDVSENGQHLSYQSGTNSVEPTADRPEYWKHGRKHGVQYAVKQLHFPDKGTALKWVCEYHPKELEAARAGWSDEAPVFADNIWADIRSALVSEPSAAPEGWVLVPVEPTEEMEIAFFSTKNCVLDDAGLAVPIWRKQYDALLAAAPKQGGADNG